MSFGIQHARTGLFFGGFGPGPQYAAQWVEAKEAWVRADKTHAEAQASLLHIFNHVDEVTTMPIDGKPGTTFETSEQSQKRREHEQAARSLIDEVVGESPKAYQGPAPCAHESLEDHRKRMIETGVLPARENVAGIEPAICPRCHLHFMTPELAARLK